MIRFDIKIIRVKPHELEAPGLEIRGLEITDELYYRIQRYINKNHLVSSYYNHGKGKVNEKTETFTLQCKYDPNDRSVPTRYYVWSGGRGHRINYEGIKIDPRESAPSFKAVCDTILRRDRAHLIAGFIVVQKTR